MSYITDIFERLDLQQIRAFLLHGVECRQISEDTYKQRLETAGDSVFKMIEKNFPNEEENTKLSSDVHQYATATQNVYMEIGMQCGAVLAMQLIGNSHRE